MFDRTGEVVLDLTKAEALVMIDGLAYASQLMYEETDDEDTALQLGGLAVKVRHAIGCEECGESITEEWESDDPYTCNACDKKINPEDYKNKK